MGTEEPSLRPDEAARVAGLTESGAAPGFCWAPAPLPEGSTEVPVPGVTSQAPSLASGIGSGQVTTSLPSGAASAELESAEGPNADVYELAAPLWQSYAGLRRYWDKRAAP